MNINRRQFIKYSAAAFAMLLLDKGPALAAPDQGVERWVKGVCRYCGTGCGVMVGVRDNKVVMVKGDPNNHNRGMLCLKGALLPSVVHAPDRLTQPLIRKEGKLTPASWDEALDLTAAKFKEAMAQFGAQSVGFYGSGQNLTEESYLANKIFKGGLKCNNVDGNPRLCMASAVGGYVTTFGKDEPFGSYEDLDAATCFFIIGSNTSECHPVLFRRIAARKQNDKNVRVIVVDPRVTNTARIADMHLAIRPGTDLALLNAMAHIILNEELDEPRFHSKYAAFKAVEDGKPVDKTFEDYRAFLAEYTPEKAAEITGIPAAAIVKAAQLFASSSATMSLWCMGLNQRVRGVWANNLVHNLHLLTGKLGRPGSTSFSLTGQPNACGGVRDTGSLAHLLPAGRVVANKDHRNQMEALWGLPPDSLHPDPGLFATALFGALGEKVKALLVLCTNPAQSLPNVKKYTQNLRHPGKFMAVIEAFGDAETLKYADVVFPAAFWCEREGVYGCSERRYSLLEKAIDPPGQARPSVNILVDLATRMGVDPKFVPFKNSAEVWDEWRTVSASSAYNFKGMTRERLRKTSGLLWPCPTEDHPGTKIRYVRGEDPNVPADHPDKYFFYGNPNGRATIWLRPHKPAAEEPDAEYPLVMTTGRVIDQWHTGTMTNKVPEIRAAFPNAYVEINVEDAKRLNINNGDSVLVETRRGKLTLPARVGEVCRPGLIFTPFFDAKKLVNELTVDAIDDISKQPEFKICAARIARA
ncbi:MAG TPA: nitrate reductase catalytic subunit [Desulfovibrio sp.]|jgi:nitrate reductase NapA|nr:nitrate reductase catalytic subunit [Desulfovibrio sp.]HBR06033.1 nitrate reductase catalytic subunit [Desulfovibrio sp.]